MANAASPTPRRRLSLPRLVLALGVAGGGVFAVTAFSSRSDAETEAARSWYAPYVDVTLTPSFEFEQLDTDVVNDLVLAFVVADPDEPCEPSWGGYHDLDSAATALDLDRRVQRYVASGGGVTVSFGGAVNDELAVACDDVDDLTAAYASVIERYELDTIDIDVEGTALADTAANDRRAASLAALQASALDDQRSLAVWLTLPVSVSGMSAESQALIDGLLAADVEVAGVNLMTMNFGSTREAGVSMADSSIAAATAASRQLRSAYQRAGLSLTDDQAWAALGMTPMLGENDDAENVFDLDDARAITSFAVERGLGRISAWSLNRDRACSGNRSDRVSNLCSGVDQTPLEFSSIFASLPGTMTEAAAAPAPSLVPASEVVDDPAKSPYPIWLEAKGYAKGKKVVWHRDVYEAKWWTQGWQPDAPVDNEWETPWRYVGPVLEGETPPVTTTLPEGTHPEWTPRGIYEKGDIVLLDGVPYQAKWWTQGTPPDVEVADEFDTPWVQLGLADGW